MSGSMRFAMSPATPLETHLASPNCVLEAEACRTQPRNRPNGLLLRCDFALRSESAGCSRAHLPPWLRLYGRGPSRVSSQD